MGWAERVKSREEALLERQIFGHSLNDEIRAFGGILQVVRPWIVAIISGI